MVSDLFTLTGINCQNPSIYSNKTRNSRDQSKNKNDFKVSTWNWKIGIGNNKKSLTISYKNTVLKVGIFIGAKLILRFFDFSDFSESG